LTPSSVWAPANVARYPLIDITNAVISRMLLGGAGPDEVTFVVSGLFREFSDASHQE
jgi:hypothetical protein